MVAETAVVCVFTNNYYDTNNVFLCKKYAIALPVVVCEDTNNGIFYINIDKYQIITSIALPELEISESDKKGIILVKNKL